MSAFDRGALVDAYLGRRVLVTGHTGFKGSWLTAWLSELGAEVTGYALPPDTEPSIFGAIGAAALCRSITGDVRDADRLAREVAAFRPQVVFHLAAQPLVRRSYRDPLATFHTNVLGTANLLEAIRRSGHACAVVVVTTDKCYDNRESDLGYREDDRLGGHDPYAASKAAAELVVESYRRSFFPVEQQAVRLASARAGNVIGGGDWSADRLVVDAVRALEAGRPVTVRNPRSVRPWQHVLEPLGGYLLLGAMLARATPDRAGALCQAWNFGPRPRDARSVGELATKLVEVWGSGAWEERPEPNGPHEARVLRLSIEKAERELGWTPRWPFDEAVKRTVEWYRAHRTMGPEALLEFTREQIRAYESTPGQA
ncbi:MAG: CDP-glucose 4,6-dehydratase [Anaeromyxobacter sp.]